MDDTTLFRLVFAGLLADLAALATTNAAGDAEEAYRKLNRLNRALADIGEAERALLVAERPAPQRIRAMPLAHGTVRHLLSSGRASMQLRGFAERAGIASLPLPLGNGGSSPYRPGY